MIDDRKQAMALLNKMKEHLPIPARPTSTLEHFMKEKGTTLPQQLEIKQVFYAGDEGGISCDVTVPGAKEAIVCSITHLHISRSHPLGAEIRAYQDKRKKRLALAGASSGSWTITPRGKR